MAIVLTFGRFDPPVPFTAFNAIKAAGPIIETTEVDLADYYPKGVNEVVRAVLDWTGPALTEDETVFVDWTNKDTGVSLGVWEYIWRTGWVSAWVHEWIGFIGGELEEPGNWKVEFWSERGTFPRQTIDFTVVDTTEIDVQIQVRGPDDAQLEDVSMTMTRPGFPPRTWTFNSPFTITDIPIGDYTFEVSKSGYITKTEDVHFAADTTGFLMYLEPEVAPPPPPPPPPAETMTKEEFFRELRRIAPLGVDTTGFSFNCSWRDPVEGIPYRTWFLGSDRGDCLPEYISFRVDEDINLYIEGIGRFIAIDLAGLPGLTMPWGYPSDDIRSLYFEINIDGEQVNEFPRDVCIDALGKLRGIPPAEFDIIVWDGTNRLSDIDLSLTDPDGVSSSWAFSNQTTITDAIEGTYTYTARKAGYEDAVGSFIWDPGVEEIEILMVESVVAPNGIDLFLEPPDVIEGITPATSIFEVIIDGIFYYEGQMAHTVERGYFISELSAIGPDTRLDFQDNQIPTIPLAVGSHEIEINWLLQVGDGLGYAYQAGSFTVEAGVFSNVNTSLLATQEQALTGVDMIAGILLLRRAPTTAIDKRLAAIRMTSLPARPSLLKWLAGLGAGGISLGAILRWGAPVVGVMGTATFMLFIGEEALQTAAFPLWPLISNNRYREARRYLKKYKPLAKAYREGEAWFSYLTPFTKPAWDLYAEAVKLQIEGWDIVLGTDLPDPFEITNVRVIDGDTIVGDSVMTESREVTIRLVGINAADKPTARKNANAVHLFELINDRYPESWQEMEDYHYTGRLTCNIDEEEPIDDYSRYVCVVSKGTTNLNLQMLRDGHALPFFYIPNKYVDEDVFNDAAVGIKSIEDCLLYTKPLDDFDKIERIAREEIEAPELPAGKARLWVTSVPELDRARIYIDDTITGKYVPVTGKDEAWAQFYDPGTYNVRIIKKAEHYDQNIDVTLAAGDEKTVHFTMNVTSAEDVWPRTYEIVVT